MDTSVSRGASVSKEVSRMCLSGRRNRSSDSDSGPDWSLEDLSSLANNGGDHHPSADQFRMLLNLLPPQSLAQVRDLDSIR